MSLQVEGAGLQRRVSVQRRIERHNSIARKLEGRDDRGWTSLYVAARKGDLDEVKRLLAEGAHVNETSTGHKDCGTTALHLAASGGHIDVMDELLECGANIDARTKSGCGWTPLHNAAKEKSKKAMHFLIKNGAFLPPDITDGRFNPPLHYCAGLEWAYEMKEKWMKRQVAASSGSEEDVFPRN